MHGVENHSNASRDGKLRYEKPTVTRIGTLEDVTQHASSGHALMQALAQARSLATSPSLICPRGRA